MKKIIGIILTGISGFFLLFALVYGLAFGGIGFFFINEMKPDETTLNQMEECIGKILDANTKTIIAYQVNGTSYEASLNLLSDEYQVGRQVTVYYEKDNPTHACVPELSEAVYGTLGTVFSTLGIGFAIAFALIGMIGMIIGIVLIRSSKKVS